MSDRQPIGHRTDPSADPRHDNADGDRPADRLVRAGLPGRPSGMTPVRSQGIDDVWTPGRPSLEWAVVLAALGILVPVVALGSAGFALRARRQGSPRWLAALLASLWCLGLGLVLRRAGGIGVFP